MFELQSYYIFELLYRLKYPKYYSSHDIMVILLLKNETTI